MSKLDLLLEAERRGILPDDKKELLEEARRRGLVPGGESDAAPSPAGPTVAEAVKPAVASTEPQSAPGLDVGLFPPHLIVGSENVAAYRAKNSTTPSPEYKAEIEAEAAKRQESKIPGEAITPTQATVGEMASFGAYPQIMAAGRAGIEKAKSLVTGEDVDFEKTYGRERDILREQINKDREKRGFWGNLPGDIAGGVAMAPARGAALVAEGAAAAAPAARSFGEKVWQYAAGLKDASKAGAGYGGAYGLNVETGDWIDKAKSGLTHAAGGAFVAPLIKTGIDASSAVVGGARNAWRSMMGPGANRAADRAEAAGVGDTLPTSAMGGPVMQGLASYISGGIGGGKTRGGASEHIDALSTKIQQQFEESGVAKTTAEAGEMAQAFLREQLFEKQLPRQGRDVKNMTPQERHDLSGIPPAPNAPPGSANAKVVEPERLTPGQQYLDSLQRYHEHTDRILQIQAPLQQGMANHNISGVSYSPEKQAYVVSKGDGSTYLADWKGLPLTKVVPEEAVYLRNLVSWLNEQPKQNQAIEALKTTADEYAAKLAEAAKSISPVRPQQVEPVVPQYKEPAPVAANPNIEKQLSDLASEKSAIEENLAKRFVPEREAALRDASKEPFFRFLGEPDFQARWMPVLQRYEPPVANPAARHSPLAPRPTEPYPEQMEMIKFIAQTSGVDLPVAAARVDRIIDIYGRLRRTRQLQDDAAARIKEIEANLPVLQNEARATAQEAQQKAVVQARAEAQAVADARNWAAEQRALSEAETATAAKREAAVNAARPEATEAATRRVAELDAAAVERAQAAARTASNAERAQQAGDIARRAQEGPGKPKEPVNYPDQFDAAYRQIEANAPAGIRRNLLGDKESKTTRESSTRTSELLHNIMDEARQRMQVPDYNGTIYGVNGDLLPAVASHLRTYLGSDIAERLASFGTFRAKGEAPPANINGLLKIRGDIRAAARDAESGTLYPGMPRPNDAAMLRRLEQAVDTDLRRFAADAGQAGKTWLTQLDFADKGYREYVEMRQLLSKIFGFNSRTRAPIDPTKAMAVLREATQVGSENYNTLKSFYRALDEKGSPGDRFRMTASLLKSMAGEAKEAGKPLHPTAVLENFINNYKNLSQDARDLMSKGESAEFIRALDKLYEAALPMEPFLKSAGPGFLVRPGASSHIVTHNLPVATLTGSMTFLFGLPGALAGALVGGAGVKALDRLLSAKWLGGWLKNMPIDKPQRSPEWTKHINRLRAMAAESLGLNDETGEALGRALKDLTVPNARADEMPGSESTGASGGEGGSKVENNEAGAFINPEGQLEVDIGRNKKPEDSAGTARKGAAAAAATGVGDDITYATAKPFRHEARPTPEQRGNIFPLVIPRGSSTPELGVPRILGGNSVPRLMTEEGGYKPGQEDSEGVEMGLEAAGPMMAGGLARATWGPKAIENSLGTFIGHITAQKLAEQGNPASLRAINTARVLEARGASAAEIEARASRFLRDDPNLAGIEKVDGEWIVEVADNGVPWRAAPPEIMKPGDEIKTTMGEAMPHPYLAKAHPEYNDLPLRYTGINPEADYAARYNPPGGKGKENIEISARGNVRKSGLHEIQHWLNRLNKRQPGTSVGAEMAKVAHLVPDDPILRKDLIEHARRAFEEPGFNGSKEARDNWERIERLGREIGKDYAETAYNFNRGEVEADNVARRGDMNVAERIKTPPEKTERVPRSEQIGRSDTIAGFDAAEGRAPALSKETTQDILKRFKAGESIRGLADQYGVDESSVRRALDRNLTPDEIAGLESAGKRGPERQREKLNATQAEEIRDKLAAPGTKTRKLEMEYDVTAKTISGTLKKSDLGTLAWVKHGLRAETAEKIGKMRIKGLSYEDIAKETGLKKNQIEHIIAYNELGTGKRAKKMTPVGNYRKTDSPLNTESMNIETRMRTMEDNLKKQGLSPEDIAKKINEAEGLNLTGDDIANGNVWWRVREEPDFDPQIHTKSGDTYREDGEGGSFWDSEAGSRRLPGHEVDEVSESRIVYPKTKRNDHHSYTQPRNRRGQFNGPPKGNALTD